MEIENSTLIGVTNSDIKNGQFTIPANIKYIGKLAFFNCTSLEELKIPEGVEAIGEYAFRFCIKMKTVEIPSSLKYIRNSSFSIGEINVNTVPKLSKVFVTPDRVISDKFKSYFPPKVSFVVKDKENSTKDKENFEK